MDDILARLKEQVRSDKSELLKLAIEEITTLRERVEELDSIFDLQWKADQRAIAMWQKEKPKERVNQWPDRVNLVLWLLKELEKHTKE